MRILVVNNNRGLVGGLEVYLHGLIPALQGCGHRVGLLYKTEASGDSIRIDSGLNPDAVWRAAEWTSGLSGELARWKPEAVYLHEPPSLQFHSALVDRYPLVMFAHDYYGACVSGRKLLAFPQPAPCSRRCGPACLALYYPRRCGGLSPLTMIKDYRMQMSRQALLGRHSAIVVASEHMRIEYLRHGVDANRVHVLPLPAGVEPDATPSARQGSRDRLLFVGRLTDLKGVEYLFHALRPAERELGRPLKLTVAGTGPDEARLRALAEQMSLNIEFTGWIDAVERTRRIRQSDLLVAPSIWPEPFGLVGIEAGCRGLPAVAYDVGGITEWLRAGESGEIAPADPPTPRGLSDAIVRALARPDHYQRLSRGAWEVARGFTMDAHLEKLLPVLERSAHEAGVLMPC